MVVEVILAMAAVVAAKVEVILAMEVAVDMHKTSFKT